MTREEAIKWLKLIADCYPSETVATEAINMAIEALSDRPTGEWIVDMKINDIEFYKCDQCGFRQSVVSNFCPNCGVRMVKGITVPEEDA